SFGLSGLVKTRVAFVVTPPMDASKDTVPLYPIVPTTGGGPTTTMAACIDVNFPSVATTMGAPARQVTIRPGTKGFICHWTIAGGVDNPSICKVTFSEGFT